VEVVLSVEVVVVSSPVSVESSVYEPATPDELVHADGTDVAAPATKETAAHYTKSYVSKLLFEIYEIGVETLGLSYLV